MQYLYLGVLIYVRVWVWVCSTRHTQNFQVQSRTSHWGGEVTNNNNIILINSWLHWILQTFDPHLCVEPSALEENSKTLWIFNPVDGGGWVAKVIPLKSRSPCFGIHAWIKFKISTSMYTELNIQWKQFLPNGGGSVGGCGWVVVMVYPGTEIHACEGRVWGSGCTKKSWICTCVFCDQYSAKDSIWELNSNTISFQCCWWWGVSCFGYSREIRLHVWPRFLDSTQGWKFSLKCKGVEFTGKNAFTHAKITTKVEWIPKRADIFFFQCLTCSHFKWSKGCFLEKTCKWKCLDFPLPVR